MKAKKNILQSFIVRGLNMGVSFLIVPITINYLDTTRYGLWVTISSIVTWLTFFDVGLGHGLRNRFAESIARGEQMEAKKYVSTAYAMLSIIVLGMIIVFLAVDEFVSWSSILNVNTSVVAESELNALIIVVFVFFAVNLIAQLINILIIAFQEPSNAAFNEFLGKALSLLLIWILVELKYNSLLALGLVLSSSPVLIFLIISIYLFSNKYKIYRPVLSLIDFSKVKDLFNISLKFFIIRVSAVVLYSTNNIIIAHLFGSAEVTPYSLALSYFNILLLLYNIVVSPFWSAFTESWVKREIDWIKSTMKKLIYFWGGLVVFGMVMLVFSQSFFDLWIGDSVQIPFMLSLLVLLWVLMTSWNGIFSQFLYGVGAIRIQALTVICVSLINIPLAIVFGKQYGINGILFANILLAAVQLWIYPFQYHKIINQNAQGIWIK